MIILSSIVIALAFAVVCIWFTLRDNDQEEFTRSSREFVFGYAERQNERSIERYAELEKRVLALEAPGDEPTDDQVEADVRELSELTLNTPILIKQRQISGEQTDTYVAPAPGLVNRWGDTEAYETTLGEVLSALLRATNVEIIPATDARLKVTPKILSSIRIHVPSQYQFNNAQSPPAANDDPYASWKTNSNDPNVGG